jgi:hypothetical protein
MKKLFTILSAISLMLFALVDFGKNVLETHFYIQLMNGKIGNFSSEDYFVDAGMCQTVLIILAVVCFIIAIVETLREKKK